MTCNGKFSDDEIRRIRKQESEYVSVVMGTCEKCGRKVPPVHTGGEVRPERHDVPRGYQSGKGSNTKRSKR
ncbi:MAG: hypothetical protein ABSG07_03885 [Terriglobales bacterium]|jgi:hypothetical protein